MEGPEVLSESWETANGHEYARRVGGEAVDGFDCRG